MKYLLITLMCLLGSTLPAQGKEAYLDYGIENIHLTGAFSYGVTLKVLFGTGNLANFKTAEGKSVVCQLDKKTVQGRSVTYLLTTLVDKKPALKTSVRFAVKDSEEAVTMIFIKVTNPNDGQFSLAEDDGTQNSLGKVLGIFSGIAAYLVDVEKVNTLAKTN